MDEVHVVVPRRFRIEGCVAGMAESIAIWAFMTLVVAVAMLVPFFFGVPQASPKPIGGAVLRARRWAREGASTSATLRRVWSVKHSSSATRSCPSRDVEVEPLASLYEAAQQVWLLQRERARPSGPEVASPQPRNHWPRPR
jgi:hypothetical protein